MIFTEKEKNKVVFSNLFVRDYPALYEQLGAIVRNYRQGCGTLGCTRDYWVRDFMPVQAHKDGFARFVFNPDYLQDQRRYITNVDKVIGSRNFPQGYKMVDVPMVMDGGNMVFCKGRTSRLLVMTEKVLAENPTLGKEDIEKMLRGAFDEPGLVLVWLPWDREDICGHTDGIVRYVGANKEGRPRVLVNLELYEDEIASGMYDALREHCEVVELRLSKYDELSWAYINCLQTEDFLIVPGIGNEVTDAEAVRQYHELLPEYGDNIYQVQMREFVAEQGGALNCLTWTIRE